MIGKRALVLVLLLLATGGCQPGTDDAEANMELFETAEGLILEGRFDAAIPLLKEYLMRRPFDPGGHYYLGRCWLNSRDPWLFLAEGELRTAHMLYLDRGEPNTIERFEDWYFEVSIHLEIAKVYLRQFVVMQEINAPLQAQRDLVQRMQAEADAARAIAPDFEDVEDLQELVDQVRELVEEPGWRPPPPRREDPPDLPFLV